jgi:trk system potassium uptake protein TrkA
MIGPLSEVVRRPVDRDRFLTRNPEREGMKRYAVIGLGLFGTQLARILAASGAEVVVVDQDLDRVRALKDIASRAIRLDARDPEALREHDIHKVDVAIVCMGRDFEAAELATLALRELGARHVLCRGTTKERVQILEALGPDRVIAPNVEAARRLALSLVTPRLRDIVKLQPGFSVALKRVGSDRQGRPLESLKLRDVYVAALLREGLADEGSPPGVRFAPSPDTVLDHDDLLVILGREADLLRD